MEKELAWLAGFIDGEGSFSMYYAKYSYILKSGARKDERNWYSGVQTSFQLSNTNLEAMSKAISIINAVFYEHGISIPLNVIKRRTKTGLPVWKIAFGGRKRLVVFLPTIIPFLVGKKREAELIMEWFDNTRLYEKFDCDKFKPFVDKMATWHANPSGSREANTLGVQRARRKSPNSREIVRGEVVTLAPAS